MLKIIQSILSYHLQAALSSLNLLCRKPFATLMTVIVIAIALALPALFWVFTDNISQLTSGWKRNGHLSLYLQPALSENEEKTVLEQVQATAGVGHASLKSAQEGLTELTAQEGMQDIMHYLPENPLPAVIEVTPTIDIDSAANLDMLARQLSKLAKVEQTKVDMEWVGRLHTLLGFATKLSNAMLVLLALAVVLIIGNTLRLAIQNRYEEIQILKLVGATDPFIIRPFLYSGIWYGLAGALVAVFLVNIFILSLGMVINRLTVVYQMHYPLTSLSIRQILLLIAFSIILGWIGARFSVKRQLASIEPAL
ncbi:permease-like cell division protein FtsX [Legionella sp. km772]|uniref:permease-like cell division protein FtsX n=1 Tax=Legionella sp. km772 TaxID=2498111 RepID=UPI000F8DB5AB|nr:permease-like cell division protein FtsX [Legionella sp. km772]RUR13674.1 cell division protein FtsX [Legionella sp. km772]